MIWEWEWLFRRPSAITPFADWPKPSTYESIQVVECHRTTHPLLQPSCTFAHPDPVAQESFRAVEQHLVEAAVAPSIHRLQRPSSGGRAFSGPPSKSMPTMSPLCEVTTFVGSITPLQTVEERTEHRGKGNTVKRHFLGRERGMGVVSGRDGSE